jgi:diguanylate cyclase (GGDEF)-like protein/PAS domain S-box-containing protein
MNAASSVSGTAINDVDLRVICDSLPLMSWTSSARGTSESLNEYGKSYTGLVPQSGDQWDWFSSAHPDDVKVARQQWKSAIRSTSEFRRDIRMRRSDGVYRWHEVRALPVYDNQGRVRSWIGTAADVDERFVARAALDRSLRSDAEKSALLDAVVRDAPIGIAFVDRNYRILGFNHVLATILETTVAENIGGFVSELIPTVWPEVKRDFDAILAGGPATHDVAINRPSRRDATHIHHWSANYYPIRLGDEVLGITIVVDDLTAQRDQGNQQLLLATIVEGSGDAIFSATVEGIITSWNPAAEQLFGYPAANIIGESVDVLVPPDQVAQLRRAQERVLREKKPVHFTALRLNSQGSLIDVEMTVSPIVDTTGAVIGVSRIAHDETEQRERERRLRESQRELIETQRIAHVGGVQYDVVNDAMTWSDETFNILDVDTNETPSPLKILSRVHEADVEMVRAAWLNATLDGAPFSLRFRIVRASGDERHVNARAEIQYGPDGKPAKMAGTVSDETERVHEERERRALELRFEASFEQSAIGTAIFSLEGIAQKVNQQVCNFLGRTREELVGQSWFDFTSPDEIPSDEVMASIRAAGTKSYAFDRRYVRADGQDVRASLHVITVRDEEGVPLYLYSHILDTTELRKREEEIAHLATHDSLTGLPNRALLTDRLAQSLARTTRNKSVVNVMFVDVDDFKEINDTLGHNYGDELLVHVATQIAHAIRPEDTVARFGGDEFVVICEGVKNGEMDTIAKRVLDAVHEPLSLGGDDIRVTGSAGISVSNDHSTPESLLRSADFAMYRAKRTGSSSVEHYDVELHESVEQRLATTSALRLALARNEFRVLYQPVVNVWTGALVSVEALVRWEHPSGVTVSPDQFVSLAEHSGLIVPIGAWVLERSCDQLVTWKKALPNLKMSVNLSVRQVLDPDILSMVKGILGRSKLRAPDLSLELTESLLMENTQKCAKILLGLKDLGVQLVIDDFGTGYSSLSYLKLFPFDAVKIDRAFVDGLGSDSHDSAIVAAIIAMSSALDLHVIAEGVESKEQLTHLKLLECPEAQGFYFSEPVTPLAMSELILEGRRWDVS